MKRPADWVLTQSARRERRIVAAFAAFFVTVLAVLVALTRYRIVGVAAVLLLVGVLVSRPALNRYLRRAADLTGGAYAEAAVGIALNELRRDSWILLHDIKRSNDANIDHIASGPHGVYVIDTKLHAYLPFHLPRIKRQAVRLHDELGVWVTPVICLKKRSGKPWRTNGVWIVPHAHLVDWLRAQRNRPVDPDRLARFAASCG